MDRLPELSTVHIILGLREIVDSIANAATENSEAPDRAVHLALGLIALDRQLAQLESNAVLKVAPHEPVINGDWLK